MTPPRPVLAPLAATALPLGGCAPLDPPSREEEEMEAGLDAGGGLPGVGLAALEGDAALDLGEPRGPAVVNLWANSCAPCREELPYYQGFCEEHDSRVEAIGIDFRETDPLAAPAPAAESGLTYPLHTDPDGELRAVAQPHLLLLHEAGEIAFSPYLEIDSVAQLAGPVEQHLGIAR